MCSSRAAGNKLHLSQVGSAASDKELIAAIFLENIDINLFTSNY